MPALANCCSKAGLQARNRAAYPCEKTIFSAHDDARSLGDRLLGDDEHAALLLDGCGHRADAEMLHELAALVEIEAALAGLHQFERRAAHEDELGLGAGIAPGCPGKLSGSSPSRNTSGARSGTVSSGLTRVPAATITRPLSSQCRARRVIVGSKRQLRAAAAALIPRPAQAG
jgi:hypothetical protein